ncbi:LysR family regulatory protein [Rasamsonia emersonii CBS 393.64]|uniref:LysR family regulatory protein n=1 Tax=Rasamsonia emersonii (strain ATCC 16479 / CBS 393.64 / IMI 116815) TaxID=1408163 RepID=A0A0F4YSA9_RASE3|nr:LysR family regulatory protein [Rasamsonia emersonii CBS 393.64]KKA21157.1 LysR family regulatory protein [Rasamsonia emersonii CBS 393.64]
MGLLFSKPKPARPATVPTDTIIPCHYWDAQPIMRAYCMDLTFRFDDVLDTDKMRAALARLLEIGDWRKLGARIRLNEAGKLEYHVPEKYDEKRPGFTFTIAKYDMSIKDHPLASRLPKMTDRPSLVGSTTEFSPLVRSADAPKKLEDWLYSDFPQLPIHVVSFNDATLLTVTFMHTLTDAMGNAVVSAFTFVPARRILEAPLSFVASQLRAALEQQRTREQIQAYVAIHTRAVDKTGQVPLFGDAGMLLLSCTNWAKGRLFEIDFSSAVIAPGLPLSQRANKLGRASYINVVPHKNRIPTRNSVSVVGKDAAGNFWTILSMRKEAWPKVDEYLRALSEDK